MFILKQYYTKESLPLKEFCPPTCGLIDYKGPVCKEVCVHKNDEVVDPFEAIVFGQLELIIGKNNDEYYLQSGGSVNIDMVTKTGREILPGEIIRPNFAKRKEATAAIIHQISKKNQREKDAEKLRQEKRK